MLVHWRGMYVHHIWWLSMSTTSQSALCTFFFNVDGVSKPIAVLEETKVMYTRQRPIQDKVMLQFV